MIRYQAEFTSKKGQQYRVSIHDSAYGGSSPVEFGFGERGFTLFYDGNDNTKWTWVIPSKVDIHYLVTGPQSENLLDDLIGSEEGRFTVEIERMGASVYEAFWYGVLLADQVELVDEYYPQEVTLTASDDLANLKKQDYWNEATEARYLGVELLSEHVAFCFAELRYASLLPADFISFENFIQEVDQGTNTPDKLAIDHRMFYRVENEVIHFMSRFDVLEQICSLLGLRCYQHGGVFKFRTPLSVPHSATTLNASEFGSDGVIGTTASVNRVIHNYGTDIKRTRGWMRSHVPPLKEAIRNVKKFGDLYLDQINLMPNSYFTSGLPNYSELNVEYWQNLQATTEIGNGDSLSFAFDWRVHHKPVSPAPSGDRRLALWVVSVQIRVGQYYVSRPVTIDTSNVVTYPTPDGGTADVFAYELGEYEWTTDSNDRFEFVTHVQRMQMFEHNVYPIGFAMPPLPAAPTSSICSVAFNVATYDESGTEIFTPNTGFDGSPYRMEPSNIRIIPSSAWEIDSEYIRYRATNSNGAAVDEFEFPETRLGDDLGSAVENGLIGYDSGGSPYVTEYWSHTGIVDTYEIHRLMCLEVVGMQRAVIRKQFGVLSLRTGSGSFDPNLFDSLLGELAVRYLPVTMGLIAGVDEAEVTYIEIYRDLSDVVTPTGTDFGSIDWDSTDNGGGTTFSVDEVVGTKSMNDSIVLGTTVTKVNDIQAKTDYISISQAVNLDTLKSDVNTHEGEINSLQFFQANTEAILKASFNGGGAGIYEDANKATSASYVGITSTSAHLQAGSNTYLDITESSPGNFDVYVQAGTTGNEVAVKAIAVDGSSTAQTATVSFAVPTSGISFNDLSNAPTIPTELDDLSDVTTTGVQTNQVLAWNGTNFVPVDQSGGGGATDTDAIELKMFFLEQ